MPTPRTIAAVDWMRTEFVADVVLTTDSFAEMAVVVVAVVDDRTVATEY